MSDDFTGFVSPEPIIEPPIPEKVYNQLWLHRVIIEAPDPTKPITFYMEFTPYDGAGSMKEAPLLYNTVPNLWELAAIDPEVNKTMIDVFKMVNKYKTINFTQPFNVWSDGTVHQPPDIEPLPPVNE